MDPLTKWQFRFEDELHQAELARAAGNEGRARVCARRAAGIVVGEYLHRRGLPSPGPSAYDRLMLISSLPDLSPALREIAQHFLVRVTTDYTLPIQADLIIEAHQLAEGLLGQIP
jgi:hypothetical protein